VLFVAALVTVNVHFTRQEQALRNEAYRAIATARATNALPDARHRTLDCVVIDGTQ
jgi:hypothetical protein